MKKYYLSVALVLAVGLSLTCSSCIGSFALTKSVLTWNKNASNKFVNELIFVAFWILPVYEVTSLADLLVINSIEFWSGTNPAVSGTARIDTEQGTYLVTASPSGYDIRHESTGRSFRLDFSEEEQTWSLDIDGSHMPLCTFIDANHVLMPSPDGQMREVELSSRGLLAYRFTVSSLDMASH